MNTPLLAFAAASALAAWSAAPSQTDDAAFYIVSGSDTVFAERVSRTPTSFSGEFADRRRGGRMAYTVSLGQAGLVTHLTTRYYRSDADTTGAGATFAIQGDSIVARMGDNAPAHVPGTLGTMPLVNPSVAFLEQLTIRARAMGGERAAIPIFIIGTPQPLAATVTRVGTDSMVLEYAGATMRLAVSPDGRILGGAVPAAQVSILRGAGSEAPLAAPRDYTAPRLAPYTSEDVVITTRMGLKLTGTLTIPRGRVGGRAPAVVTITGSGAQDRDGEPPALKGYRPFRELADTLGHRGIAVLRLDDRGVNGSEAGPKTATTKDFADDIAAAVMYLRKRREIDATRIALVGHSEGAVIAPMVSIADGQLRGIVLMAGWASLGRDIVRSQQHYVVDTVGKLTGKARETALSRAQQSTDSVAQQLPWMKYYLDLEPAVIARRVETPALILHGESDHQVPSSEAERLATAFRTAGNRRVTVRLFPETNHLFVADAGGGFDYASLPSLRVRPAVLSAIAEWLSERF